MQLIKLSLLPAILGTTLVASVANAADEAMARVTSVSQLSNNSINRNQAMSQVTSVSQLSDVQPTDWAFQALQSLVERYGCIAGYPDRTYRGNRALTRYEFAAGMNACMDRINELIAAGTENLATKEDLATLQRLQEEFAAELATVRGQVDALEVRTATLEAQQFSTTTKLSGEVLFGIQGLLGNDKANGSGEPLETNTTFGDRVRLNFDTSFNGEDLLRVRFEANNIDSFADAAGTNEARLGYDGDNGNNVEIDELYYRFKLGENFTFQVDATNLEFYDALITTVTPFASSGGGSISRYGRFSPLLRAPAAGGGVTARWKISDMFALEAGYVGDSLSNSPTPGNGLFNGNNKIMAQLVTDLTDNLKLAVAYGHSYAGDGEVNVTGSTGSFFARRPFGNVSTSTDEVLGQIAWKASKTLEVGGWFGYQWANELSGDGTATLQNWMAFASIKDFLAKGNQLGLQVGNPPKVLGFDSSTVARAGRDDLTPWHLEAFYKVKINDNIDVTPGMFVILNPENVSNDAIYVGAIRTRFRF